MSKTKDPFDKAAHIDRQGIKVFLLLFFAILIFPLIFMMFGSLQRIDGVFLILLGEISLIFISICWMLHPISPDWILTTEEIKVYLERKPNARDLIFSHLNERPLFFSDLQRFEANDFWMERKKVEELFNAKCQAEQLEAFKNA